MVFIGNSFLILRVSMSKTPDLGIQIFSGNPQPAAEVSDIAQKIKYKKNYFKITPKCALLKAIKKVGMPQNNMQ